MGKKNIAIFASGSGSNAEALVNYFAHHADIEVVLILSNRPNAYVLTRAQKLSINSQVFNRSQFLKGEVLETLVERGIDYIVLAGFLWLVPKDLILAYRNKIINIHPSLLPKYGGKGMYGNHVHQAVLDAEEPNSGITIHLVDEIYDNGRILCQKKLNVDRTDTAEKLAQKIHKLEHEFFPKTVEEYILQDRAN